MTQLCNGLYRLHRAESCFFQLSEATPETQLLKDLFTEDVGSQLAIAVGTLVAKPPAQTRTLQTGFTGRPQIAGFLAPGAGRHTFRRLGTTQGDCDGSDRVYVDSGNRRRFVCSNPLRAVGKRSGV